MITYFIRSFLENKEIKATSDLGKSSGIIRFGLDSYAGYYPLSSNLMKSQMLRDGYHIEFLDDGGNYSDRFRKLRNGELDMAVATIDSYLIHGEQNQFPASIIAVISESKGSDAIVASKDRLSDLDAMKAPNITVAFTPDSPSHFLLKTVGAHFGIDKFKEKRAKWRVETNGSEEALLKLLNSKVDAAVLWEPDISKALKDDRFIKLLGTENTDRLIVDVLLVSRDFLQENSEVVELFLSNYYRTLKHYRLNANELYGGLEDASDLPKGSGIALAESVRWFTLSDNASDWFGMFGSRFGLLESIESTLDVLIESNDFSKNPIPGNDPRNLIYSDYIVDLSKFGLGNKFENKDAQSLERDFRKLSNSEWDLLKPVGSLKVRAIDFSSGSSVLTRDGYSELDVVVDRMKSYPNFRIRIEGHTSIRGDKDANQRLSQERAEAVARYMIEKYSLDIDRLYVIGKGGEFPKERLPNESYREYLGRLPRVEIVFLSEVY